MLRSGYSSEDVLRELATRKFADTFDSTLEKELVKAGATQSLIDALRSGVYQASETQVAALKTKQDAGAQVRKVSEAAPTSTSADRAVASTHPIDTQIGGSMYDHFKDDLVYWHDGTLTVFDDETLQKKKFFLLFFSAVWSRDGRQFTPQLVDYYNRVAPQHPEFEIIFFSADRSAYAMENYVSQTNMPWPLVAYDKLGGKAGTLANNLTHQIPRLLLAEASGKVLSDSGEKQPNFGKVLADTDRILADNK